jgi:hypothetical protein
MQLLLAVFPITNHDGFVFSKIQAIDKLEDLLNGGMDSGQSSMFGPREYVQIYT